MFTTVRRDAPEAKLKVGMKVGMKPVEFEPPGGPWRVH